MRGNAGAIHFDREVGPAGDPGEWIVTFSGAVPAMPTKIRAVTEIEAAVKAAKLVPDLIDMQSVRDFTTERGLWRKNGLHR